MNLAPKLLSDCHQLALSVAPELAAQQLYILDADELRALPSPGLCYGWATSGLFMDRNIADLLGDRYAGPGPTVAIDAKAIAENAAPGQFERCVQSVLIHEIAHVLPARNAIEPADTPRVREIQLARMANDWQMQDTPGSIDDPHGLAFIRRCCHLWFRATASGYDIPWRHLFGGPPSWLSPADFYLTAAFGECFSLLDATFAEIEEIPPPEAIVEQFENDLARYQWQNEVIQ